MGHVLQAAGTLEHFSEVIASKALLCNEMTLNFETIPKDGPGRTV